MVDVRGFNVQQDVAGSLVGGVKAGQGIRNQFTNQQVKQGQIADNNQFRQLTAAVLDPSLSNEQRMEAQRQRAAINPEVAAKLDREQIVTDAARQKEFLTSTVQGALDVNSIPTAEGKLRYIREVRKPQLLSQGKLTVDTDEVEVLLANGDEVGAQKLIDQVLEVGVQAGLVEDKNDPSIQIRQESNNLRARELSLKEGEAERKAGELSSTAQKILDTAQTSAIDSSTRASSLNVLANDLNNTEVGGGVTATFKERLKELTGDQDAVTNLRKQFNQVRITLAIQNLPPGVASDKDIELALAGFPTDRANKFQMVSFLRGMSKLEKINEGFQTFKSETISNQKDTKGLLKKWKTKVPSDKLGRDVEVSELYITAANKGLTIDDVKQKLGVR